MTANHRQDMPPPGGYNKFNWARTYPKVFWKAEKLLGVVAFLFGYGLFQARALKRAALIFKSNIKRDMVVRAIPAPKTAEEPRSFFDKKIEHAQKEFDAKGLGYITFDKDDTSKRSIANCTERFEDKDLYIAMTPFLYAERDRRWLKLLKQNRDNEIKLAEISGDKAWRVGTWYGEPVYFTLQDRWWDPTPYEAYAHSPMKNVHENFEFIHRSDHV